MLTFEWYGQACFKIENSTTIVTDPHNGETIGLNPPPTNVAELITISHGHHDHASGEDLVARQGSVTVRDLGEHNTQGIKVKGLHSFHDKAEGAKRGENIIFVFELAGTRVCHLGDLGHDLAQEDVDEIRPVDVLLTPVGGNYTINGTEAATVTEKLLPRIVIPMHFRVDGLTVDIDGPEEFLKEIENGYEIKERERLELEEKPERKLVLKLDCLAT
ncbi:MBL fold metallo-hydrolase [Candidatus Bipolaricaulota bacterium]|nr:MBL fold metallo-hydrolase [Candidatus Bipolaricaulota bacterium]